MSKDQRSHEPARDLTPVFIRGRRLCARRRRRTVRVLVFGALTVTGLIAAGRLDARLHRPPPDSVLDERRGRLETLRAQIRDLRAERDAHAELLDAERRLLDRADWGAAVRFLASAAGDGVTVGSLQLNAQGDDDARRAHELRVNAGGRAGDRDGVTALVRTLERTPQVRGVDLSRLGVGADGVTAFDIRFVIAPAADAMASAEGGQR